MKFSQYKIGDVIYHKTKYGDVIRGKIYMIDMSEDILSIAFEINEEFANTVMPISELRSVTKEEYEVWLVFVS